MTPSETGTAVGAFTTTGVAFLAMVRWVFTLKSQADKATDDVENLTRDMGKFNERLERAEQVGGAVKDLAAAVKEQGSLTAMELKNLNQRFGEHASFTKEQFSELQSGQRTQEMAIQGIKVQIARLPT